RDVVTLVGPTTGELLGTARVTRRGGRTQLCDRVRARTRLDAAQKSFEVAELAAAEHGIPASRSVAAALAVLSGIASADAACCAALGRRSRDTATCASAGRVRGRSPAPIGRCHCSGKRGGR